MSGTRTAMLGGTTRRLLSSGSTELRRPLRARYAAAGQSVRCETPAAPPDTCAACAQCCRLRHQDADGVETRRGGQDGWCWTSVPVRSVPEFTEYPTEHQRESQDHKSNVR
jgi:hypothetical protein